jgi:hypothetical protein
MTERFDGLLRLGPLEKVVAVVQLIPLYRGEFAFEVHVSESFHWDRYPNWLWVRRKVLRMKSPRLRPLIFRVPVQLSVRSWAVSRDSLPQYVGRGLTKEEIALDDDYERRQRGTA